MELENVMLSEISQAQKNKYLMFSLMGELRKCLKNIMHRELKMSTGKYLSQKKVTMEKQKKKDIENSKMANVNLISQVIHDT